MASAVPHIDERPPRQIIGKLSSGVHHISWYGAEAKTGREVITHMLTGRRGVVWKKRQQVRRAACRLSMMMDNGRICAHGEAMFKDDAMR